MRDEWNIVWFQTKKIKACVILSVVYLYAVVLTLQQGIIQQQEQIETMKPLFFGSAQKYIPLLGVFWGILLNRIYFEDRIAEIVYTADRFPKIRFSVYYYVFLQLMLAPMYGWYYWLYQDWYEILRLAAQMAVLQFGLFFCGSLLRSGILAAGVVVCGAMLMQYAGAPNAFWNYFQIGMLAEMVTDAQNYFLMGSIDVFLGGSIFLERIRFR